MNAVMRDLVRTMQIQKEMLRPYRHLQETLRYGEQMAAVIRGREQVAAAIRQREQVAETIRQRTQMLETMRLRDLMATAEIVRQANERQRLIAEGLAMNELNGIARMLRQQREPADLIKPPAPLTARLLPPPPPPGSTASAAARTAEDVIGQIREFQDSLDHDHEIALTLTGPTHPFVVHRITACGLMMLRFEGVNTEGHRVQLVEHVNLCSVHMVAVPKSGPEPTRIGFVLSEAN